uniref:Uncharacterized protein n=1 Tax=Avena sativa TaxID=4498 RepID=A0ACD5WG19_AVESA
MSKRSSGQRKRLRRGLWSPEEDMKLMKHVSMYGHGCWSYVPKLAGIERGGKSCRLRWLNYLRPDLKRGAFSLEEERLIVRLHSILGNRWSQIAARLAGRTDNDVKNFWHSIIKKKLQKSGIDPVTHKPVTEGSGDRAATATATATAATIPMAEFGEAGLNLSSAGQHPLAHVPSLATTESCTYDGAHASMLIHGCWHDVSMEPLGYTQTGDFTGCLELETDALQCAPSGINVHPPPVIPVVLSSSSSTVCSIAAASSAGTGATVELWQDPGWMGTFTGATTDHYGTGATLDELRWSDCVFEADYQLNF